YQFVYADVREVEESGPARPVAATAAHGADPQRAGEFERALSILLSRASDEERRDAAQELLRLDAEAARRELEQRDEAALALAMLRDARWEVAGAASVPFLGHTGMWQSGWTLARLRIGELRALALPRWIRAVIGGAAAGVVAGALGGTALWL